MAGTTVLTLVAQCLQLLPLTPPLSPRRQGGKVMQLNNNHRQLLAMAVSNSCLWPCLASLANCSSSLNGRLPLTAALDAYVVVTIATGLERPKAHRLLWTVAVNPPTPRYFFLRISAITKPVANMGPHYRDARPFFLLQRPQRCLNSRFHDRSLLHDRRY